jgi:hypothetical protein
MRRAELDYISTVDGPRGYVTSGYVTERSTDRERSCIGSETYLNCGLRRAGTPGTALRRSCRAGPAKAGRGMQCARRRKGRPEPAAVRSFPSPVAQRWPYSIALPIQTICDDHRCGRSAAEASAVRRAGVRRAALRLRCRLSGGERAGLHTSPVNPSTSNSLSALWRNAPESNQPCQMREAVRSAGFQGEALVVDESGAGRRAVAPLRRQLRSRAIFPSPPPPPPRRLRTGPSLRYVAAHWAGSAGM